MQDTSTQNTDFPSDEVVSGSVGSPAHETQVDVEEVRRIVEDAIGGTQNLPEDDESLEDQVVDDSIDGTERPDEAAYGASAEDVSEDGEGVDVATEEPDSQGLDDRESRSQTGGEQAAEESQNCEATGSASDESQSEDDSEGAASTHSAYRPLSVPPLRHPNRGDATWLQDRNPAQTGVKLRGGPVSDALNVKGQKALFAGLIGLALVCGIGAGSFFLSQSLGYVSVDPSEQASQERVLSILASGIGRNGNNEKAAEPDQGEPAQPEEESSSSSEQQGNYLVTNRTEIRFVLDDNNLYSFSYGYTDAPFIREKSHVKANPEVKDSVNGFSYVELDGVYMDDLKKRYDSQATTEIGEDALAGIMGADEYRTFVKQLQDNPGFGSFEGIKCLAIWPSEATGN